MAEITWATLLGLTGITLILTRGEIFASIRYLAERADSGNAAKPWYQRGAVKFLKAILTCPQCSGFWVGVLGQTIFAIQAPVGVTTIFGIFLAGGLVSVTAVAVDLIFSALNVYSQR
jgi:hypothetical protein